MCVSKCLCVGVMGRFGKRRTQRVVAIPGLDCPSCIWRGWQKKKRRKRECAGGGVGVGEKATGEVQG